MMLVSESEERQMGLQAYQPGAVQGAAVATTPRPTRWSRRSAGASPRPPSGRPTTCGSAPRFRWEFKTVDKNEPNAFCLPGGKVVVYTGLLPITKTEAGLAVVIGHEVAHALARHGAER